MSETDAPVLALDTASLYFRSYYALPSSMRAPDGSPHGAIRGLLATMTRLIDTYRPSAVVAAWDADWRPQWRVDLVPSYKAHRVLTAGSAGSPAADESGTNQADELEEGPEDLGPQVVAIAELLDLWGIPRWGHEGFEADDVLGTVASRPDPTIVVSGDRDLIQLIDESTQLLLTVNGGMDRWPLLDPAQAEERFGVTPEQYAAMAVLRGDPSDGLPGVPGIGAKTAVALVRAFHDLDGVLAAAVAPAAERPMTPRMASNISTASDGLRRALTVTTVVRDVPVPRTVAPLPAAPADARALAELAEVWGVTRQVDELAAAIRITRQTLEE